MAYLQVPIYLYEHNKDVLRLVAYCSAPGTLTTTRRTSSGRGTITTPRLDGDWCRMIIPLQRYSGEADP